MQRSVRSAVAQVRSAAAPATRPLVTLRPSLRLVHLSTTVTVAASVSAARRWLSTGAARRASSSQTGASAAASSESASAASTSTTVGADHPPLPAPLFLRMPSIEGVGKCVLQRWCVSEGASFRRGDVLAEIDSDLAVIEYKAQDDGVMALHRAHDGDKIVEGQILAVQVGSADEVVHALPWLHHVEKLARHERREIDRLHAQEEAEAEAIAQVEREAVAASQAANDSVDDANSESDKTRR